MAKVESVNLLIFQSTSFCNIDCDYCYLPDRDAKRKISIEVIEKTIENLLESNLVGEQLSVVWHSGEPLVMPLAFYKEVVRKIASLVPPHVKVRHSIQSNGMLVTQEWCDFLREEKINFGVSIDGPEFIHNFHRKTRNGKGTFKQTMRGIELLQKNNVHFYTISVISKHSLDYPNEIFHFFADLGVKNIALNVEEIEGINKESSHEKENFEDIINFMRRMHQLEKDLNGKINIREFDGIRRRVTNQKLLSSIDAIKSDLASPFNIISVGTNGDFSTFSPELLEQKDGFYDNFIFGNVFTTRIRDIVHSDKFQLIYSDISEGVEKCKAECDYYLVCGGGAPSNKLYENQSFKSTETLYCIFNTKIPTELVLQEFEDKLALNIPSTG